MFLVGNALKVKEFLSLRALGLCVLVVLLTSCAQGQDQTVPDYAIAYVKRPLPLETVTTSIMVAGVATDVDVVAPVDPDVREATDFNPGGDVYLRERASSTAEEKNITLCITDLNGDGVGTGDVRDLETNFDGTKLIFSLRLEDLTNGNDVPKWNIYQYDTEVGGCPTQVMTNPLDAAKGDDVSPHFLPDGRIVYSSNAAVTTREVELNAGKSQFSPFDEDLNEAAVVLHVMNADGSNIKQISFNQSNDLDASVLSTGEIVFSRWDGPGNRSAIRLYTIHPDGTELKALYGLHDANVGSGGSTVQFMEPRELSNGRVLAMLKPFPMRTPFNRSVGGGTPVEINVADYTDINQPTVPNLGILSGPGQVRIIDQDVRAGGSVSPGGRYRSVYPLGDGSNRALVSWSQCRLQPTDADGLPDFTKLPTPCPETIAASDIEAFPLYGIYVYDFGQDTQIPVVIPEEGTIIDEPVVLAPRPRPTEKLDSVVGFQLDQTLAEDEFVGILHIRSVYDFDGGFNALGAQKTGGGAVSTLAEMADPTITDADHRSARYLRIVKATAIPDPDDDDNGFNDNVAFGAGGRRGGMREIIGYAPIEPDGSVMTKVPADMPLAIEVVDKNGRRIGPRHLNWIQVRAGETVECTGCHTHTTTAPALPVPHGYNDAPTPLNAGAQLSVPSWVFPGTTTDDPTTPMPADETVFPADGETMAEARIRVRCTNGSGVLLKTQAGCPQLTPNANPVFFDLWATAAPIAADLSLRYANLDPAMAAGIPTSALCIGVWNRNCRTIINYETSIKPLWSLPRPDAMSASGNTCTVCHNNKTAGGADMVPAGQLDLSDLAKRVNANSNNGDDDRLKSYQELLIRDNFQWELIGTTLSKVQATDPVTGLLLFETTVDPITGLTVQVLDGAGNPIPIFASGVAPSMSVNGAVASSRFFNRFTTPGIGTFEHMGLLSPAELRLLYEWLDIGAQYFNNTFDAP